MNARKVIVVLRRFPPFRTRLVVVGCRYGGAASAMIRVFETSGKGRCTAIPKRAN